jgi:hypothetical protein
MQRLVTRSASTSARSSFTEPGHATGSSTSFAKHSPESARAMRIVRSRSARLIDRAHGVEGMLDGVASRRDRR